MHCTCQLEVSRTRSFRLENETLQCLWKNIDRYLRIASDIDFPFEQRLLQFLERQELIKMFYELGKTQLFVRVALKSSQTSGVTETIIR